MRALLPALLCLTACATSYRPANTGPSAFSFALTPEQCLDLKREQRAYRGTTKASLLVAGSGAVVTGIALALSNEKVGPAIGASVGLLASGTGAFAESQVTDLEAELQAGGCR